MPSSSYSLGLFFIFLVAVIWSIASIVVQYLYTNQHFDSPFLLTYIGTSLFVLLLLSHFLWERKHQLCCYTYCSTHDNDDDTEVIPWRTRQYEYQQVPPVASDEAVSLENVQIEVEETPDKQSNPPPETTIQQWSHEQHIKVAIKIAPVWFIANWAYNSSLAYTSITSSTVLASTGSLFTFIFAVVCRDESFTCLKLVGVLLGVTGSILTGLHDVSSSEDDGAPVSGEGYGAALSNDDAVVNPSIMCVAGPSGTPHHIDLSQTDAFAGHAVWGDALGLLSAVGYGAYAVMIRIMCPRDESLMSMQLLLGYIGLFNAIVLSPIAIHVLFKPSISSSTENGGEDGTASGVGLTWVVFGYLVAKGTLDNVLSDYLWARAVVLTSATVATVGLGLTIPLAFVSDWIMGHDNVVSAQSILGASSVLAGFILVNIGEKGDSVDGLSTESDASTASAPALVTTASSELATSSSSGLVTSSSSEVADDSTGSGNVR